MGQERLSAECDRESSRFDVSKLATEFVSINDRKIIVWFK